RVPHDRLFKELLGVYLYEFLELFLPELAQRIEPESLQLIGEKELLIPGETTRRADLVARARIRGMDQEDALFLIHVEHEAQNRDPLGFPRRMLRYALHLRDTTGLNVYPIALVSYPKPKRLLSNKYEWCGPDGHPIFTFTYRLIQLNRLDWRDYAQQPNPVAAALMTRMGIEPKDRPLVKLQCLRLLRRLNLSRDRSMLISTFLDTYLQLDSYEEEKFRAEFAKINPEERDEMLELTNNWFEAGKAEERQRTEQIQRERDAERQRADLAEREQKQERKKAEHEARRAEILAQRLRELGVDPDSLTD
ncbi:MAG: flagellar assembly protein H, partial [Vulcanimicrobiota bacterium]